MANGTLGFQNPSSEDKLLDTTSLTVAAQTVHRERIQVAGGADVELADVKAASPASGAYGLVVRDVVAPDMKTALDAIQTAVQTIDNMISGSEGQVDVVTSALPSGAATAANQSTANTALSAIQTALETIDNMISGSEAQVDIVSQPALARTTDAIAAALQTDALMNGLTALTPKFAIIDAATSGDNTLVAAVASKKIRVIGGFLVAAGTVNTRFESGASGTALTGQSNLVANTGFVLPFNPVGWFETASNTLLNLELSAAISVDGCLVYVEV